MKIFCWHRHYKLHLQSRRPEDGEPHVVEVGLAAGLEQHEDDLEHGLQLATLHHGDGQRGVAAGPHPVKLHPEPGQIQIIS